MSTGIRAGILKILKFAAIVFFVLLIAVGLVSLFEIKDQLKDIFSGKLVDSLCSLTDKIGFKGILVLVLLYSHGWVISHFTKTIQLLQKSHIEEKTQLLNMIKNHEEHQFKQNNKLLTKFGQSTKNKP